MDKSKKVEVFGDELTIRYDGNMWVAPSTGSQHARATDAMREEIEAYYSASGENVDEASDEIESYVSQMVDAK